MSQQLDKQPEGNRGLIYNRGAKEWFRSFGEGTTKVRDEAARYTKAEFEGMFRDDPTMEFQPVSADFRSSQPRADSEAAQGVKDFLKVLDDVYPNGYPDIIITTGAATPLRLSHLRTLVESVASRAATTKPDWYCMGCGSCNKCRTIKYGSPGEPVDYDMECTVCGSTEFAEGLREAFSRAMTRLDTIRAEQESAASSSAIPHNEIAAPQERPLNTNGGRETGHIGPQSECQSARGEAPRVPAAAASSTPPAIACSEIEQGRAAQAAAVMPLIGNLLDQWDGVPNDLKKYEGLESVRRVIGQINKAMESAPTPPTTAMPNDDRRVHLACEIANRIGMMIPYEGTKMQKVDHAGWKKLQAVATELVKLLLAEHPSASSASACTDSRIEYADCTLCAAPPGSEGFYTGCMVKDGNAHGWSCDGKGKLIRWKSEQAVDMRKDAS